MACWIVCEKQRANLTILSVRAREVMCHITHICHPITILTGPILIRTTGEQWFYFSPSHDDKGLLGEGSFQFPGTQWGRITHSVKTVAPKP